MNCKLLSLKVFGDERGNLVALEGGSNVPFEIKRVFYMYDTGSLVERGNHANKFSNQMIISLSGSCSVTIDDGNKREVFKLSRRDEGLFVGSSLWKEIKDFSKDCVLMVLTDTHYDKNDYILDYEEFLVSVGK